MSITAPDKASMLLLELIGNSRAWFWPMLGACAGMYCFYRGFCLLQRKRLIMDTPASKIRSAAMGLVEVSGLATGPYTLTAPITGVPCYFYRSTAWEWKQQGRNSSWQKVAEENMHVPFYLDDNTGRVLVNPQGAELDIHCDFKEEFSQSLFGSSLDIPMNASAFLLRHGVSGTRKIKLEEHCIKPKNALFILGTLATNPGVAVKPDPVRSEVTSVNKVSMDLSRSIIGTLTGALIPASISTSSDMSFTMSRTVEGTRHVTPVVTSPNPSILDKAQQEKIGAALMKAGITSPTAWAAAGLAGAVATGVAVATDPNAQQFDFHPATVLMKGTHDSSFLISWHSQREVVKSLSWKSALMIWGGPVLTVLCVYILAARLGWV